jgi:protein-S-isoprenylcysteine O-methyltransferase Ste14
MSLIPGFELGLWNGWILSAIFLFANYLVMFIAPKDNIKEMMDQVKQAKKKDKLINLFSMILYMGVMFCSIFVPLKLGSIWFYVGLALFVLGMSFIIPEVQLFFRKKGQLLTKGFYRISRHPIYVMVDVAWIGIGVATESWALLALIVLYMIVLHFLILAEERICLEKYGDVYREYMKKTPRYIGIPKKEIKK